MFQPISYPECQSWDCETASRQELQLYFRYRKTENVIWCIFPAIVMSPNFNNFLKNSDFENVSESFTPVNEQLRIALNHNLVKPSLFNFFFFSRYVLLKVFLPSFNFMKYFPTVFFSFGGRRSSFHLGII